MPFEARVFIGLLAAEWIASHDQTAQRDIYLMEKKRRVERCGGIKLCNVPVARPSSSSAVAVTADAEDLFKVTLRCKLEVKERGTQAHGKKQPRRRAVVQDPQAAWRFFSARHSSRSRLRNRHQRSTDSFHLRTSRRVADVDRRRQGRGQGIDAFR
jgi:hypothetical protein